MQILMTAYAMHAAVETQRKYKHVLWYSLFVAAYLIVLYLQASAYNSGEVVSTLRNALMPCEHCFCLLLPIYLEHITRQCCWYPEC